jgi:hypothetical protein
MSEVLQCPYCALRFTTQSELDQHKAVDHPRVEEEKPGPVVAERETPPPEEPVERTSEKRGFLSRLFKRS